MRAIQKSKNHEGKCVPNVLPCRINRDGPINASKRYWYPTKTPDGKTIAYVRGRKLHGRQLRVPVGYKGVVMSASDDILPKKNSAEEAEDEEEEEEPEVKIMEEQSTFVEVIVWGHETVLDESDPYVRGLEEWIGFAEQIHSHGSVQNSPASDTK